MVVPQLQLSSEMTPKVSKDGGSVTTSSASMGLPLFYSFVSLFIFITSRSDVHAIIFVIDSTDRVRLCVAKEELDEVLKHKEVNRIL